MAEGDKKDASPCPGAVAMGTGVSGYHRESWSPPDAGPGEASAAGELAGTQGFEPQ